MALDQTGIIVFISFACVIFAVVSAYLIYQHVQDEKENVYRARVRREKDQMGPSEYVQVSSTTRKGPVIAPPAMAKESEPVPDPIVEPIITDELPPKPEVPKEDTNDTDVAAVVAPPAVALAGGAAAATIMKLPPPPPPPPAPVQPPQEKPPKTKNSPKKQKAPETEDFDDYRNYSPKALPPPKGAPPAAKYVPPASPVYVETQPSAISWKSLERARGSSVDREGLQF